MPDDETLIHPEQPRFLLSAWLWAVALFAFFGVIVAIAFGAMHRGSTYEVDRARARTEKLRTAKEEWNKTSSSYGWVDQAKGIAHIPIQRAMQLELADLQSKKPAPAGPIATPEPAAAAAPAAPNTPTALPPATLPGAPIPKPTGTPAKPGPKS